jgi:methylmalonyl-CoA mutase C-terminal domain/subunit
MTLFPRVLDLLAAKGADEILVFGGGIIPDDDIPKLKELGVAEIFTPGARMDAITDWLESALDDLNGDQES